MSFSFSTLSSTWLSYSLIFCWVIFTFIFYSSKSSCWSLTSDDTTTDHFSIFLYSPLAFSCSPWILTSSSLPPHTRPGLLNDTMGRFVPHVPWDQASWFFQFHFIGFWFPLACALIPSLIFPSFLPFSPCPLGSGLWFFQFHFIGFWFPFALLSLSPLFSFVSSLFPIWLSWHHNWPLLFFFNLSSDSPWISSNAIHLSILPCWTLHSAFDISFLFFFFCSERPLPLDALRYNSTRLFLVSPIYYFPLIFLPISSPNMFPLYVHLVTFFYCRFATFTLRCALAKYSILFASGVDCVPRIHRWWNPTPAPFTQIYFHTRRYSPLDM